MKDDDVNSVTLGLFYKVHCVLCAKPILFHGSNHVHNKIYHTG